MYSMIITITMRHSRKRRTLRLSISLTSLRREVANRHSINSAFLLPGFLRWPLSRLFLFYPLRCVLSNIISILQDEAELRKLPPLFFPTAHRVNAGGVDAAVAEDVRETHDILEPLIMRPGEEVADIAGKDFD